MFVNKWDRQEQKGGSGSKRVAGKMVLLYKEESAVRKYYKMTREKKTQHWQASNAHFQQYVASPTNAVNEIDTSWQKKTPVQAFLFTGK